MKGNSSFMDKLKNVGPNADPWGAPAMFLKLLLVLLTQKLYLQLF